MIKYIINLIQQTHYVWKLFSPHHPLLQLLVYFVYFSEQHILIKVLAWELIH